MKKISKFVGLATLLLAGVASALTINDEKYWYCLEWTSNTTGEGDVILTQVKSETNPYTSTTTCFENWVASSGSYAWKGFYGTNIGALVSKVIAGKRLTTFKLGSNIDFGGKNAAGTACVEQFEPITNTTGGTIPVFDGQDNEVRNLCYIKQLPSTKTTENIGFFASAAPSASLKNVKFVDPYIQLTEGSTSVSAVNVGVLVGDAGDASIENVSVSGGNILTGSVYADAFDGGIAGTVNGANFGNVSVTGMKISGRDASSVIGGVVGYAKSTKITANSIVSGDTFVGGKLGGFAGQLYGNFSDGRATLLSVENNRYDASSYSYAGGVIGYIENASGNFYLGNVSGLNMSGYTGSKLGGFAGYVSASSNVDFVNSGNFKISGNITWYGSSDVGGVIGEILIDNTATGRRAEVNNSVVEVNLSGASGNVGGLVGSVGVGTTGSTGKSASLIISQSAARETISTTGTSNTFVGGVLGYQKDSQVNANIWGNLYKGNISSASGSTVKVGYLVGSGINSSLTLKGNYHYGQDAVVRGIGTDDIAAWKLGSASIYGNIRNVSANVSSDDGPLGLYSFTDRDNSNAKYLTPFNRASNAYVRNGVATVEDMKSGNFAAVLNGLQSSASWYWVEGENDDLPTPEHIGKRTCMRVSLDVSDYRSSLTTAQMAKFGVVPNPVYTVSGGVSSLESSSDYRIFGYNEVSGLASQAFVDSVNALSEILETTQKVRVVKVTTSSDIFLIDLSSQEVYGESLTLVAQHDYEVSYEYCTSTTSCQPFADVQESKGLYSMNPMITEINDDVSSVGVLIPMVVSGSRPFAFLTNKVLLRDEDDVDIAGYAAKSNVVLFSSILKSTASKIVVQYYDAAAGYKSDSVIVKIPQESEVSYTAYAQNGAGEQVSFSTGTSPSVEFGVPAGYVSFDFTKVPVGYTYDGTYDATYTYAYKSDIPVYAENGDDERVYTDFTHDMSGENFGLVSDLASQMDPRRDLTAIRVRWNFSDLTSSSKLDLYKVLAAPRSLNDTYRTTYGEYLTLTPAVTAIPYNVTFDLAENAKLKDYYGNELDVVYFIPSGFERTKEFNLDASAEMLKFPEVYALAIQGSSPMNSEVSGWTVKNTENCYSYGGYSLCGDGEDGSLPAYYGSFASQLLKDAESENAITTAAGQNNALSLVPVWYVNDGSYGSRIYVDRIQSTSGKWFSPVDITLSQKYPFNGTEKEITHNLREYTQDRDYFVLYSNPKTSAKFEFLVDYKANPGFAVDGLTFTGTSSTGSEEPSYDPVTKTLTTYADLGRGTFTPSYTAIDYKTYYDLSNLGDDIFVAEGFESPKAGWTVLNDPNYVVAAFDETNKQYNPVEWNTNDALLPGYDGYTAGSGDNLPELILRKKSLKNIDPSNFSFYTSALYVDVMAVDLNEKGEIVLDENDEIIGKTAEGDYHGSIVFSQTVSGVEKPYEHRSSFAAALHQLVLPPAFNMGEVYAFDVSASADPGFAMRIVGYDPAPGSMNFFGTRREWLFDSETGVVRIRPKNYQGNDGGPTFYVKYDTLDYSLAFTRPSADADLYFGLKAASDAGKLTYDWTDGPVTSYVGKLLDNKAYTMRDGKMCQVGWVMNSEDWPSDVNGSLTMNGTMASLMSTAVDANNVLKLDMEHPICQDQAQGTSYHTMTLNTDGNGTIEMYQPIVSANGAQKGLELVHQFTESRGSYTLKVPAIPGGVRLYVRSIPKDAETYVLDKLSLDYTLGATDGEFVGEDDMYIDVDRDLVWNVSFKPKGPFYVKYDLELAEADYDKMFLPYDAKVEETLLFENEGAYFWMPVRSDLCFAGWSMKRADKRGDADPVFFQFTRENMALFSTNDANPTILYPVWNVRSSDNASCKPMEDTHATNPVVYAEVMKLPEGTTTAVQNGSFVITQTFGDIVLEHTIPSEGLEIPKTGVPYGFHVTAVPDAGYMLDGEVSVGQFIPGLGSSSADIVDDGSGNVPEDPAYLMGQEFAKYYVGAAFTEETFNLAFKMGSAENVLKTVDWIDTLDAVSLSNPKNLNAGVARGNACFSGWGLEEGATTYYTTTNSAFFNALKMQEPVVIDAATDDTPEKKGYFLYPVWNDQCSNVPQVKVVAANSAKDGQFVLKQGSVTIPVTAGGVNVPADAMMNVDFVDGAGVTHAADAVVSAVAYDADGLVVTLPANSVTVGVQTFTFYGDNRSLDNATEVAQFKLEIAVEYTAMDVAFNVNVAAGVDVFYEADWSANASYKMDEENLTLPTVYQSGAVLKGWAFENSATAQVFTEFNDEVVDVYNAAKADLADGEMVTLHAMWDASKSDVVYTVVNGSAAEGSLSLSQTVDGKVKDYDVGENGLKIPTGANNEFTPKFIPKAGYVLKGFQVFDLNGKEVGDVIAVGNTVSVTENIALGAVVEASPYTVVFDVNAPDGATVFYGKDWMNSRSYDLMTNTLQTDIYAVGYRLDGWKLTLTAEEIHETFDAALQAAAAAAEDGSVKVYANWIVNEKLPKATITSANLTEGTMKLYQVRNDGSTTTPIEIGESGVVVPQNSDVELVVTFEKASGYVMYEAGFYTATDASDKVLPLTAVEGGAKFTVTGDVVISAPVVEGSYEFAFDVNAGKEKVFYGTDWVASKNFKVTDADLNFPMDVYRDGACIEGWALSAGGTAHTKYDAAFIAELDAVETVPTKLTAVWNTESCEQNVVTLSTNAAGSIKLTQSATVAEYVVSSTESLNVPAKAGVNFKLVPELAAGYIALNNDPLYYMVGEEKIALANDSLYMSADMDGAIMINIPAVANAPLTVVFNVNATEDMTVFYGNTWKSSESYELDATTDLPKNLYAAGKRLAGWKLSNSSETIYTAFDGYAMHGAANDGEVTLFGNWVNDDTISVATITSGNLTEGTMTLSQVVEGSETFSAEVGEAGVQVPLRKDIELQVKFVQKAGYSIDPKGFYTTTDASNKSEAIPFAGEGAKFSVSGDVTVNAPVVENAYEFAFNVNAGKEKVFYGADWVASKNFKVTDADLNFPMDVYRDGACLDGWALTADGTAHKKYDAAFIAELKALETVPAGLSAVWNTEDCEQAVVTLTTNAAGSIKLTQSATTAEYVVSSTESLKVPAKAGVNFKLVSELASGYIALNNDPLYYMVGEEKVALADSLYMSADMAAATEIIIPAVANAPLTVVFDVNAAEDMTVFYGNTWKSLESYNLDEEKALPANLYAEGMRLAGWKLKADAKESFAKFDAAAMYDAAEEGELTLYASWVADTLSMATITSANLTEGTMTLSQVVEGSETFSAEVSEAGVQVPLRKDIELRVKFEPRNGYSINPKGFFTTTGASNVAEAIPFSGTGAVFNVTESVKVSAPINSDGYIFVFDANTTDNLFYVGEKVESASYSLAMDEADRTFPTNIYSEGKCLTGWALAADGESFSAFDKSFVDAYAAAPSEKLFAIWSKKACDHDVVITVANAEVGSVKLVNVNDGKEYILDSKNSLNVPAVDGIKFTLKSTLESGFIALYDVPMYYMNGENKQNLVNDSLHISSSMTAVGITIPAVAIAPITVVFDVNAPAGMNVFYGGEWNTTKQYDITESETLPTNIYGVGYKFNGWKLAANGTTTYKKFNAADMYNEDGSVTLFADWVAAEVATAKITSANLIQGTMTLTQIVNNEETFSETVGANGVVVPLNKDIELQVSFETNTGYSIGNGSYTSSDASGKTSALAASATGAKFNVTGDAEIAVPVESDGYEFVFDANAEGKNLFYVGNKVDGASYKLSMSTEERTFPTNVYRADACLTGWALSTEGPAVSVFDAEFLKTIDGENNTLYAIWNTECDRAVVTISVVGDTGSVTLTNVNDKKTFTLDAEHSLVVPAEQGISFTTEASLKDGFINLYNEPLYYMVDGDRMIVEDGVITIGSTSAEIALHTPAVASSDLKVVFNANAPTGVNVFYGLDWIDAKEFALTGSEDLPKDLYSVSHLFKGWKTSADANETYSKFDGTAMLSAAVDGKVTLFADWAASDTITKATITSANLAEGEMTLSQIVDGVTTFSAIVGEDGVQVPLRKDVELQVDFKPATGYSMTNGFFTSTDASGKTSAIVFSGEGAKFNVASDAKIAVPVTDDAIEFAFNDMSTVDMNLFYVGAQIDNATYSIAKNDGESLPMNIYRADACLEGWAFTDGGTPFKKFDAEMVKAYKESESVILYAVWNSDCEQKVVTLSVTNPEVGYVKLVNTNDKKEFFLDEERVLKVPAVEGIDFSVTQSLHSGYIDLNKEPLYYMDGEEKIVLDDELNINSDMSDVAIIIPAVANNALKVVFDVNASGMDVFYGLDWTASSDYSLTESESLPMNLYSASHKFNGWKLSGDAEKIYSKFDAVDMYTAATDGKVTLFADWAVSDTISKATISSANLAEGTMVVSQIVDGVETFSAEVGEAGVQVPFRKDIELNVKFEPSTGYSLTNGFFTATSSSGKISALPSTDNVAMLTVSGDVTVSAPIESNGYEFAFDANAENENLFYVGDMVQKGSYMLSMASADREFPSNIYRAGACLEGWALTANGTAYKKFDESFVEEYASLEVTPEKLIAVWNTTESCEQPVVTLTVANAEVGSVKLIDMNDKKEFTLSADQTLEVPSVEGINFSVSYTVNLGYSAVNGTPVNVVLDGEEVPLQNNILALNGQEKVVFAIPATLDKAFEVVFSENTSAKVFYGDSWERQGAYTAGDSNNELPTNLYRTDAKLKGWAFTPRGKKVYSYYDSTFIEDVKLQKSLGVDVDTLYAIWDSYAMVETRGVAKSLEETGTFFIYQVVEGMAREPVEVTSMGVQVPFAEDGLTFYVNYEPGVGYSLTEDGYEREIHVYESRVLSANVVANPYTIVFNVNAGNDNVFYGNGWKSENTFTVASHEEFTDEIYQADKILIGWSLESDGSGVPYRGLSEELIEQLNGDEVNTLYAVWENSLVETYTVSFANTEVGDLKLTQVVEENIVEYAVGESGLKVPVVDGGFRFLLAFNASAGYAYDEAMDSMIASNAKGDSTVIKHGELLINQNMVISLPLKADTYELVFNVNTDRKDVIYGDGWISSGKFNMGNGVSRLPQVIYTADACVAGWTVGNDTTLYAEFNEELVKALRNSEPGEQGYVMNAQWNGAEACADNGGLIVYDRLTINAKNGSVEFLESHIGADAQFTVAHTFASDNTMLLPRGFNGVNLVVHSIPDSSYVMENVVMTRANNNEDVYTFTEGDALILSLSDAVFTTNFVKSNKAKLQIVSDTLEQSGNAIRLSFATNEFEVTRGAKVNVSMMDAHGNIVVDTLLTDSVAATPAQFVWNMFPVNIGEYTVIAEIYDATDTASVYKTFSVEPTLAAISDGGWQMISMAAVDTAAIVWDDDPAFFWWDEHSKSGEYWQYKEFVAGGEIIADRGYWYSSLEGRPLALNPEAKSADGDMAWALDYEYSGWNLVANPYGWNLNLYNDNKAELKAANDSSNVEFWRYNSETAEYEEVLVLKPFEAVWAHVNSNTSWNLKAEPEFVSDVAVDFPEVADVDSTGSAVKRKALAKANAKNNWSIQAVLSDNRGKKDSWNILGVSSKPFVSEEPPEAQGDHVTLSVMDGKKSLAKSFKALSDSYEWELALSATSERMGNLTLVGVSGLRSLGYHVYVTVDGKTVEMNEGDNIRVSLKSRATTATVRVTAGQVNVVASNLNGLNMTQAANKLHVGFDVDESLAGSRTVVDVVDLDGKVLATYSSKAQAGRNMMTLEAPRSGLYMLRVRVASQQLAGKIMVK